SDQTAAAGWIPARPDDAGAAADPPPDIRPVLRQSRLPLHSVPADRASVFHLPSLVLQWIMRHGSGAVDRISSILPQKRHLPAAGQTVPMRSSLPKKRAGQTPVPIFSGWPAPD